jgi:hypothetical protein
MKAKDIFGLAIRLLGLGLCINGADNLSEFIAVQIGYFTLQRTDPTYYFVLGVAEIIVGLYFLRGAPHFVRYAYPDDDVPEPPDEIADDGADDPGRAGE